MRCRDERRNQPKRRGTNNNSSSRSDISGSVVLIHMHRNKSWYRTPYCKIYNQHTHTRTLTTLRSYSFSLQEGKKDTNNRTSAATTTTPLTAVPRTLTQSRRASWQHYTVIMLLLWQAWISSLLFFSNAALRRCSEQTRPFIRNAHKMQLAYDAVALLK